MSKTKDFGQIYQQNIAVLTDKKALRKLTDKEGEVVYSVFPAKYDYMNEDLVCMKMSLQSARLFLETPSFSIYAKSLALVQKSLSDNYYHKTFNVTNQELFGPERSLTDYIFSNYRHLSKFVKGESLTEEIIKHAISLKDHEKSSIIIVIGNHSITVVMENKGDQIRIGYYDVELSQLYFQKVSKQELSEALKSNLFINPLSIINQENYLLARIFALVDDVLDSSIPLAFMSFISDVQDPNFLPSAITVADNLTKEELAKSFAQCNMLDNVNAASNILSYKNFILKNKKEIIGHFLQFKQCVQFAAKVSQYLDSALTMFKNTHVSFQMKIDYPVTQKAVEYRASEKLKEIISIDLCVKKANVNSEVIKNEKKYLSLLIKEKGLIHQALSQCLSKSLAQEKILEVNQLASYFTDDKFSTFNKAKKAFFNARDSYRDSLKDNECSHPLQAVNILNDVTIDDMINHVNKLCVGINQDFYNETSIIPS